MDRLVEGRVWKMRWENGVAELEFPNEEEI